MVYASVLDFEIVMVDMTGFHGKSTDPDLHPSLDMICAAVKIRSITVSGKISGSLGIGNHSCWRGTYQWELGSSDMGTKWCCPFY